VSSGPILLQEINFIVFFPTKQEINFVCLRQHYITACYIPNYYGFGGLPSADRLVWPGFALCAERRTLNPTTLKSSEYSEEILLQLPAQPLAPLPSQKLLVTAKGHPTDDFQVKYICDGVMFLSILLKHVVFIFLETVFTYFLFNPLSSQQAQNTL
jgi:hypothetical protein